MSTVSPHPVRVSVRCAADAFNSQHGTVTPPQLTWQPWRRGLAVSPFSHRRLHVPQDRGDMCPASGDPQFEGRHRGPQSQAGVADLAGAAQQVQVGCLWGVSNQG